MLKKITLLVNDQKYEVEVEPDELLVDVLREKLALTGTKKGCGTGDCGACTVIMDGRNVTSCLVLAVAAEGRNITTIEGMCKNGNLHPIQQSFIDHNAVQCGYCTPGLVLSTKALLDENPHPTEEEIRRGISGNLCRCTGYQKIVEAVKAVAEDNDGGSHD
ncbi:MAG: (2Fe-2S)-binding protein [Anaerolineaceae bacterium]